MKRLFLISLLVACATTARAADNIEVAGYVGRAFPFYDEDIRFDPGSLSLPGGSIVSSSQPFGLHAKGGLSASAGVTLYLADAFGIEGRIDTADVNLDSTAARYRARFDLPAPLPDANGELTLGGGVVDLQRFRPLSVNLKFRTPGRVRLTLSGGLSYLPALRFDATDAVRLTLTDVSGVGASFDLASLGLRAEALPTQDSGTSRLGGNVGLGVQFRAGARLRFVAEGRYFLFREHTLHWSRLTDHALSDVETTLAEELEARLEPVQFNPTFFHASVGVALTF
jgi:hypothetical protein